jgi:hypothetical protein
MTGSSRSRVDDLWLHARATSRIDLQPPARDDFRVDLFALKILLAPTLVVVASVCARRFGAFVGGLATGLPVVAGPILLALALSHGSEFGAEAARASVLGLISLTGFALAYGFACRKLSWQLALPLGWAVFLSLTAGLNGVLVDTSVALVLATSAFVLTLAALPSSAVQEGPCAPPSWDLPVRATAAAAMVVVITGASSTLGSHLSGLLAPFPIAVSVLAAFTHAQGGPEQITKLLRGFVLGLFAFAVFCAGVATLLTTTSTAAAFALASALALSAQALVLLATAGRLAWLRIGTRTEGT